MHEHCQFCSDHVNALEESRWNCSGFPRRLQRSLDVSCSASICHSMLCFGAYSGRPSWDGLETLAQSGERSSFWQKQGIQPRRLLSHTSRPPGERILLTLTPHRVRQAKQSPWCLRSYYPADRPGNRFMPTCWHNPGMSRTLYSGCP